MIMIQLFEEFEQDDIDGGGDMDLSLIPTWCDLLNETFKGRKVRIVLGHPGDGNFIEGVVTGFDRGTHVDMMEDIYVLLDNPWDQHSVDSGRYNKHHVRAQDRIQIIE